MVFRSPRFAHISALVSHLFKSKAQCGHSMGQLFKNRGQCVRGGG